MNDVRLFLIDIIKPNRMIWKRRASVTVLPKCQIHRRVLKFKTIESANLSEVTVLTADFSIVSEFPVRL